MNEQRTWWDRNWKWLVPVTVAVPLLVCGGGITFLMTMAMGLMKSTPPYQQSLAAVTAHTGAGDALGTPIEAGWLVAGNVQTSSTSGHADIAYTVRGPSGSARVRVVSDLIGGEWTFSRMDLEFEETGKRLDLLAPE
jgi:hypothetical protein